MNYEINEDTLALIPYNNQTRIIEKEDEFIIDQDVNSIIYNSCEYFGSSYEGRKKGTTSLTGLKHKLPIIIEESKNIIFFPTSSPRLNLPIWIALNSIKEYNKLDKKSEVILTNNTKISLDVSFNSLNNQILRASRLESVLNYRKN